MLKLIICLFSTLLVLHFADAVPMEDDTLTIPPIDEELPLILIETGDHLGLPTNVQFVREGLLRKKKLKFGYETFFEQRFYYPQENAEQLNKLEKGAQWREKENEDVGEKIDEHCLFQKKKTKEMSIPSCDETPQPKIMRALENETTSSNHEINHKDENRDQNPIYKHITRGPSDVGRYFVFGYLICVEFEGGLDKLDLFFYKIVHKKELKNTTEASIYEFCYNNERNEIMYTTHRITAPALLFKNYLKKEREKTWNNIETYNSPHLPEINFEDVKLAFKRVQDSYPYKIQLLVPQEDFPFLVWKRPVSHYANANLIHEELHFCWNKIHEMIRKHAIGHMRLFDIYTGAFKLSEEGEIKTIEGVEIPKIWVKIIHHNLIFGETPGVAIIANNYRNETVDQLITNTYKCKVNICIDFINTWSPNISNHIRCCELNREIIELFGGQIEISSEVLKIDDLISNQNA